MPSWQEITYLKLRDEQKSPRSALQWIQTQQIPQLSARPWHKPVLQCDTARATPIYLCPGDKQL